MDRSTKPGAAAVATATVGGLVAQGLILHYVGHVRPVTRIALVLGATALVSVALAGVIYAVLPKAPVGPSPQVTP